MSHPCRSGVPGQNVPVVGMDHNAVAGAVPIKLNVMGAAHDFPNRRVPIGRIWDDALNALIDFSVVSTLSRFEIWTIKAFA